MSGSKYVWTTRIADGYRHVIPAQTSSYRLETTSRIGLGGPYEKKTSLGPQYISEGKVRKKREREREGLREPGILQFPQKWRKRTTTWTEGSYYFMSYLRFYTEHRLGFSGNL